MVNPDGSVQKKNGKQFKLQNGEILIELALHLSIEIEYGYMERIEKNYIKSIDEKVLPYFSEYTFKHNLDLKNKITIRNLLTNQSGLDCDVYNAKAVGNESIMAYEKDWIQYSLDLPMVDSAGGIGQYCSSNPIILGRILEKSTKMSLPNFAKQTLFKDLGIKKFVWHFKPDPSSGETFCQLNLRSRDMAKFGLLYLNAGFWNGKQVIQKEWD